MFLLVCVGHEKKDINVPGLDVSMHYGQSFGFYGPNGINARA